MIPRRDRAAPRPSRANAPRTDDRRETCRSCSTALTFGVAPERAREVLDRDRRAASRGQILISIGGILPVEHQDLPRRYRRFDPVPQARSRMPGRPGGRARSTSRRERRGTRGVIRRLAKPQPVSAEITHRDQAGRKGRTTTGRPVPEPIAQLRRRHRPGRQARARQRGRLPRGAVAETNRSGSRRARLSGPAHRPAPRATPRESGTISGMAPVLVLTIGSPRASASATAIP